MEEATQDSPCQEESTKEHANRSHAEERHKFEKPEDDIQKVNRNCDNRRGRDLLNELHIEWLDVRTWNADLVPRLREAVILVFRCNLFN